MIASRVRFATVAGCATTLLLSTFCFAGAAQAQTPDPAAAPAPVRWQGNAAVSVSIQSGVTDQRSVSVNGEAFRAAVDGWSYSLQGDHTYASVKLGETFQTVAESQNARFTAQRALTDVLYFVIRPAFKRNEVQAVDYRFEGLAGLGAQLSKNRRVMFDVLGVGGFISQDKNVESVDGTHPVAGVVQTSQVVISPMWRLSELALFLRPFGAGDDYRMQFQTSLVGTIVGPLALNVSYNMDRENVVLGGNEKVDRRLTMGVQLNF